MKKKTILFSSIFVVFLTLLIPHITAVEYNEVTETIEAKINTCKQDVNELPAIKTLERLLNRIITIQSLKMQYSI